MRAYTHVRAREEGKGWYSYASPGGDVEKARITTERAPSARRSPCDKLHCSKPTQTKELQKD